MTVAPLEQCARCGDLCQPGLACVFGDDPTEWAQVPCKPDVLGQLPVIDDDGLFDMLPDPVVLGAARAAALERAGRNRDGLSAGQRLTLRQKADVANGRHPLMGGPTAPELGTCGLCVHRVLTGGHSRSWPKCDWGGPSERGLNLMSSSASTDCRAWWPACPNFEPKPKEAPDD